MSYRTFTNCLESLHIDAPYINIIIDRDCYCYNKWDNKPYEIIKVIRKTNEQFIENNDIIKTINKKKYQFLKCNHIFLEYLIEKEKHNNKSITFDVLFGS